MKKNLVLLTGIVFLFTILIAGGCSNGDEPKDSTVIIYLQAHEIDGKMHLKMYDSNDKTIVVIDTLHTVIQPGTEVIWMLPNDSGIRKIQKISPKNGPGNIIHGDARGSLFKKEKKLKIHDTAQVGEEGYLIKFKGTDGKPHTIDPFLKIPPGSGGTE